MKIVIRTLCVLLLPFFVNGCALTPPAWGKPGLAGHQVQSVNTDYSLALACLGELIEQTAQPSLTVYIENIRDNTVPRRFRDRRLSSGGYWWLHNAITRLETDRVISQIGKPSPNQSTNYILLNGAWTQDDQAVQRLDASVEGRGRSNGGGTRGSFFFGSQRSRDVIAGDFLTIRDGRVLHATAISVALSNGRTGIGLDIQDGSWRSIFDLSHRINEGPQFAQRRITEAAALVHIAHVFELDYRPCAELDWASPKADQAAFQHYMSLSKIERQRSIQNALVLAGYAPGAIDGIWGQQSASALLAFQRDSGLADTGVPSMIVYAALQKQKQAIATSAAQDS